MELIFIPAPGSPCRVIKADNPQPAESWAEGLATPENTLAESTRAQPAAVVAADVPQDPPDFLDPLPKLSCLDCPDLPVFLQSRQQGGYYKALWQAAKLREQKLQARIAELEAQNRILNQRLFGKKSEAHHRRDQPSSVAVDPLAEGSTDTPDPASTATPPVEASKPRRRGQQKANKIPPRRDYSHLPSSTEVRALCGQDARCSCCGKPFTQIGFEKDTSIIEVEVKTHRRIIRRRRYRKACQCPGKLIHSAPPVERVLPKTQFGVSVWVRVLLDKYQFCRPTNKLLEELRSSELDLAIGTITDDLKRLLELLKPLKQELIEHNRKAVQWHADETRWPVFQVVKGKVGTRWYAWLFESADCAVFVLDPGRAHDVPEDHFGEKALGIVVVDRYSAYKAMKHVKAGRLILAFCWAHHRRDFLDTEKSWPKLSEWTASWIADIAQLYKLNARRKEVGQESPLWQCRDQALKEAVKRMAERIEQELADKKLHPAKKKVLMSMKEHWGGLTIFVDKQQVPMDNNQGERTLRIAALGRKNYYGSGARWSGELAATMFSLIATLKKWELNPREWLTGYLQACAEEGGKVPKEFKSWLPWNLSEEQKKEMGSQEEQDGQSEEEPAQK